MRPFLILALAVLATSRPAHACDFATAFDIYDRAEHVIVGTVATSAAVRRHTPRAAVVVTVETVLKGAARGQVTVRPEVGLCEAELYSGDRALIFLDARGSVIQGMDGYMMLSSDAKWPGFIARWAKADTDAARLDLLLEWIELPELESPRSQAAEYLANAPRLLARIDAARRARIVKAVTGNKWHPNYAILILARLRAPELAGVLEDRVSQFSYVPEMRALLGVSRFVAITDRNVLAAAMTEKDASWATRAAALERCEMLRGEHLESFVLYLYDGAHDPDAVDWRRLAAACNRG